MASALGNPRGVSFQQVWQPSRPEPTVGSMPTPQHPINSGFTADSTIAEVLSGIDLTGRLAVDPGQAERLWAVSAQLTGVDAFAAP